MKLFAPKIISLSLIIITLGLTFSCGKSPFLSDKKGSDSDEGNYSSIRTLENDLVFKQLPYVMKFYWKQGPDLSDENRLLVVVLNRQGRPTSIESEKNYRLHFKLWMPGMNHGSYPVNIVKVDEGVYEINEIFFTMEGYWDFHFQVVDEEEKIMEEVLWGITLTP